MLFISLFQTHSPVKSPLLRISTQTPPSETSPAVTPSTCFWVSAWPGPWRPCTGLSRARSLTWTPDHWPSPSHSSLFLPSSAWRYYCSGADRQSGESWAALVSRVYSLHSFFWVCGSSISSSPALRLTATSRASERPCRGGEGGGSEPRSYTHQHTNLHTHLQKTYLVKQGSFKLDVSKNPGRELVEGGRSSEKNHKRWTMFERDERRGVYECKACSKRGHKRV